MKRAATAAILVILAMPSAARAWDSGTHRMITRIAVAVLPASSMQSFLEEHINPLQEFSTDPDTKLRALYGRAEERRHFIDLEVYGPNPWSELLPDRRDMDRVFGAATLDRSGSLPWTIEDVANALQRAWMKGDCGAVLRQSGYLSHYIGDASQPLHSTVHYDGYDRSDRGLHLRIENAVDEETRELTLPVRQDVSLRPITSVWDVALAEIRESSIHVESLIDADRYARMHAKGDRDEYRRILMREERDLVEHQLARGVSVLAEVWSFAWQRAGQPKVCGGDGVGIVPIRGSSSRASAGIPSQ
jgi:hypothetical protein